MLNIRTPFYSAGRMYGWEGDTVGVGIALSKLVGQGVLEIKVGKEPGTYRIDKKKARDFIKNYISVQSIKGIPVGVIQLSQFELDNGASKNLFSNT